MVTHYQNFEFGRNKLPLQNLLDDFTPWVDGTNDLSNYPNIWKDSEAQYQTYLAKDQKQKAEDFAALKADMSKNVGIYLGDKTSIINAIKDAYPEAINNPSRIAETEYRIKRLLCGYEKETDASDKSFYEFNINLTKKEQADLIAKINEEDQIYRTLKLNKGLLNIIKAKLTGPHKLAKSVILDEVLEECEEIRQQDLAAQINSQDEKTAAVIKLKSDKNKLPKKKPVPPKWAVRARNSLSRLYAKKGRTISFRRNIGK